MKILILITTLFFAAISQACPDFSGKFADITSSTKPFYITITQKGCEQVTIYRRDPLGPTRQNITLDGVRRLAYKADNLLIYEMATFNNLGNIYFEYDNNWLKAHKIFHTRIFYVLEDNKDVTEYRHLYEGDDYIKTVKTTFYRKVMSK